MGRGDKKTKRGKINRGSFGKTRRPAGRKLKVRLVPPPIVNKPAAKSDSQPAAQPAPEPPAADAAQ